MHGIALIDKHSGPSSFDLLQQLRKSLMTKKIGYLGTLDPLASGLLVFFIGKATKLIKYFENNDKTYLVDLELGKSSDTYDRTGRVKTHHPGARPGTQLAETLDSFLGDQWQITPSYSAIKFQGKRAYAHAREGKDIDLGKRQVSIHSIDLLEGHHPYYRLKVNCSSGTYIRSFVHELGEKIGTGALMTELRRTQVGPFQVEQATSPEKSGALQLIPTRDVIDLIDWENHAKGDYAFLKKNFSKNPDNAKKADIHSP